MKQNNIEMQLPHRLLRNARRHRKEQTDAEALLWRALRNKKLNHWKFRRQHPMSIGYILDFFCSATNVAIELDGKYHYAQEQMEDDLNRTEVLAEYGIRLIRFDNAEVINNLHSVLKRITDFTRNTSPPLRLGEGAGG